MNRKGARFKNHLDEKIVHLHKNLYISPADPLYYEKVIRYLDPHSPEAHYKLGEMSQKDGKLKKALFHYQEALRVYPSPYYSAANRAVKEIVKQTVNGQGQGAAETAVALERPARARLPFIKTMIIALLLLNMILLSLYFSADSISKIVSKVMPWGIGKDVTYEAVDIPYVMYFPNGTATNKIESALHEKAIKLGADQPKSNILIYGVAAAMPELQDKTLPLTDNSLKTKAFVIAEYNSFIDNAVKIRFLHVDFPKERPLSAFSTNLVRTALQTYMEDHGEPPESISLLLQDYPNNYLSFLPLESRSHSNAVRADYDGKGGWVYNDTSSELSSMFYPNVELEAGLPYEPVQIQIVKSDHSLRLMSGTSLIMEKKVGLGAGDQTPEADFVVEERVLKPLGSKPGIFGAAGLGLGNIAIHGTNNEGSIGKNLSLGCVRLLDQDMDELYTWVPMGAKVHIVDEDKNRGSIHSLPGGSHSISEIIPNKLALIEESAGTKVFEWLG
ncbi:L,D-transpeptidase family protein [Paenibacillus eucommiae]|uniref:Tetratricopeptide (TPR) repeat protein n=1 Tax=Paenibacillus eucommiae TaxID=1355755 RepID=A0ABS4J682_9BACL|nr:L,D-transpeptidase family protein [Paenibacillus eucommiae]MBP1995293.1 tetratricopeptide (TPR) repeat protein [Paenibacillus eucommiae]